MYKSSLSKTLALANEQVLAFTEMTPKTAQHALHEHPPVFIVGPPRSGSTVLMQILAQSLNVSYLTNRHRWFYGNPAIGEIRACNRRTGQIPLHSVHGATNGPFSPWEGASWWYRFFPREPNYVDDHVDVRVDKVGLRSSLANWTSKAARSVLFKNLFASLRIRSLSEALPEALYLHLFRNEIDNAHSILEGRQTVNGNYTDWWSMRPPGWESVRNEDPVTQVLFQIRRTHEVIDRDLLDFGVPKERHWAVHYEEFCTDLRTVLTGIQQFLGRYGVTPLQTDWLPDTLNRRLDLRIPKHLYSELQSKASLT